MRAIEQEIRELVTKLDAWSVAYHRDDNPIASDAEYDRALRLLRELEAENPHLLSPTSPTQRVGDKPLSEFQSVVHKMPMLSLDNAFSGEDLKAFEEAVEILPGIQSELATFIEGHCTLEETPEVMTALAKGERQALKIVIDFSEKDDS